MRAAPPDLESLGAQEVLAHVVDEFHPRLYVACCYGISIDVYKGQWIDGLWQHDPDACCGMRKVEPLERALDRVDAWITGLRRDQSPRRAGTPKLVRDARGKYKCAPLADWTEKDVWRYIHERDVIYNPLHDRGYDSIGCTHCTVAGGARDGRWAGTDKIECGLHLTS